MNLRHIWIVLKKELKDIIRDKKTVITNIVVPVALIPLLLMLVGGGVEKLQKDITENITIGLSETSRTEEIKAMVENDIIAGNTNIKLIDIDESVQAIRDEKVRIVLDFEKDYAEKLKEGKPFAIKLMYDKTKAKSEGAIGIVSASIESFKGKILAERIAALGLSPEILVPASIEATNVADEKQSGNPMLVMILPLMIGMLVVVGGIPPATDLVAGEKERNTFEPLLTTKPSRASILAGKFITVALFSMVSFVTSITGLAIGYSLNPNTLAMGTGEGQLGGFNVPPTALLLAVLIAVALCLAFAGIQITLSTYAKSFKEAQTYLSFLIFAAMIPGYATMFMQPGDIPTYMFLVPILNTISAFKMILGGSINYTNLTMALVSSVVFVVISLVVAASMFNKEKVLFRS